MRAFFYFMDWALNAVLRLWLLSEWCIVAVIVGVPFAAGVAVGWFGRRMIRRRGAEGAE